MASSAIELMLTQLEALPLSVCLLYLVMACVTMPLTSPVLVGRSTVLDCLARLEKAEMFCSATLSEAAAPQFSTARASDRRRMALDLASALANSSWASPAALFICSAFSHSEASIWACLRPSVTLMAASCVALDASMEALFLHSASTCIDSLTFLF